MSSRYSIVFQPPTEIVDQVQEMKSELAQTIGWYASRNAMAHITIQEFEVNDKKLEVIKSQLERCCNSLAPIALHFNSFDSYPNGAFFIKPDLLSIPVLSKIMKQVQQAVPTPNTHRGTDPHLTIARKLTFEKILIARELFQAIDLDFSCDRIALRQFNPVQKQFEIIAEYPFLSLPDLQSTQGSLF